MESTEPLPQFLPDPGVERTERLIEKQYTRFDGQRAGQGDSLTLSSGQFRRISIREKIELDQPQQLVDLGFDLIFGRTRLALHAKAKGDILEHRHVTEKSVVLENETDLTIANT